MLHILVLLLHSSFAEKLGKGKVVKSKLSPSSGYEDKEALISDAPTDGPSNVLSQEPSRSPSDQPSDVPSDQPSDLPSMTLSQETRPCDGKGKGGKGKGKGGKGNKGGYPKEILSPVPSVAPSSFVPSASAAPSVCDEQGSKSGKESKSNTIGTRRPKKGNGIESNSKGTTSALSEVDSLSSVSASSASPYDIVSGHLYWISFHVFDVGAWILDGLN